MNPQNGFVAKLVVAHLAAALTLAAQQAPPTVMAGTKLRVQFDNEVDTAISRINDGVKVHLIKPVEAEGHEVLPVGTILSGRVLAVRKGDKHTKAYPMIHLRFNRVTLPDGRSFPTQVSLADLGVSEYVDSEGAASTRAPSKAGDIGVPVATGAAGAGIGAIGGGAKGAEIGAGVGAAVGVLSDMAAHAAQWYDFKLKRGRKAWLHLDADLELAAPGLTSERNSAVSSTQPSRSVIPEVHREIQGETRPPEARRSMQHIAESESPPANVTHVQTTRNYSERFGQLLITVKALNAPAIVHWHSLTYKPQQGHWFLIVELTAKNVSEYPNCTGISPTLVVDRGYTYHYSYSLPLVFPHVDDMLPGKVSEGRYVFEPHTATKPSTLILRRGNANESGCARDQRRPVDTSGGEEISVGLEGLPISSQEPTGASLSDSEERPILRRH